MLIYKKQQKKNLRIRILYNTIIKSDKRLIENLCDMNSILHNSRDNYVKTMIIFLNCFGKSSFLLSYERLGGFLGSEHHRNIKFN